jgi:protein required for attachment to host cells
VAQHKTTWIVMADGSRALIVTRRDVEPGFDVVSSMFSDAAHVPSRDIGSDRPGRTQESGYSGRHAIQPRHDPHQDRMTAFVDSVARYLNEASGEKKFDRLILFAADRALGRLRAGLDKATSAKVQAESPKDLTKIPLAELPQHLESLEQWHA